jgi:hypothetical protein
MREAILNAIEEWDRQWKMHSQVGSEDAAIRILELLNHLVDSGSLPREKALGIFTEAGRYITLGERDKLHELVNQVLEPGT